MPRPLVVYLSKRRRWEMPCELVSPWRLLAPPSVILAEQNKENRQERLLLGELEEINSWARLSAQLYCAWFTLMLTVNILAVGWLVGQGGTARAAAGFGKPAIIVLIAVNLVGVIVAVYTRGEMLEHRLRIQAILDGFAAKDWMDRSFISPRSALSVTAINTVFAGTATGLLALLVFWSYVLIRPGILS
jgi:hypothetical protein